MMNSSIGFKIKKLREQKEISQEDLAFQLEVSQSYLSKIEKRGHRKTGFHFYAEDLRFF
jgi:transcriptional regulator with XRE-family HTH domain